MALAIFVIAGVSLAQALQVISLTVSESVDQAVLREEARATLLEVTRNPALAEGRREVASTQENVLYRINVESATLKNQKAATLPALFEVVVETFAKGTDEPIDSVSTLVHPPLFRSK